jgi:profilin
MKAISSIVSGDDAAKDKAFAEGLYICGSRYVMARADGRSIYARQVREPLGEAHIIACLTLAS